MEIASPLKLDRESQHRTKAVVYRITWGLFFGALAVSVWLGSNVGLAEAVVTSGTTAVTVTATVASTINLYVSTTSLDLGTVTAGTDVYGSTELRVRTNSAVGYKAYTRQNKQLDKSGTYITEANMGSAAAPTGYTSTTTGLAFSMSGVPAASKWNAAASSVNANYASFTSGSSGVEVNNYGTYSAANTTTTVFYRLDVVASQHSGVYSNETYWSCVTGE